MKPFYLYILRCGDGSFYVGHTDDLATRLEQHENRTFGGYTARRHPLTLVFVSEHTTRAEVLERERQIKGWSRAKKEALTQGDWARLHDLAKETARRSAA